jgi:hypothetical protein
VRQSWATGESVQWIKVHDLPDFVYFNHEIHVNKGIGCASCHGRVDLMPLMYEENTLQMEWCLTCHRNPKANLRPTSEIYNMAWEGPSSDKPVWCGDTGKGGPTAQSVACTTKDPASADSGGAKLVAASYSGTPIKFTSQDALGLYLTDKYHIRPPNELQSCEVCHR